jgi:hypothetical protein
MPARRGRSLPYVVLGPLPLCPEPPVAICLDSWQAHLEQSCVRKGDRAVTREVLHVLSEGRGILRKDRQR